MHAIVSIHDVSPANLPKVQQLIQLLPPACHPNLTLLIIPGHPWSDDQLDTLKQWQQRGYHLAGHGWHHRAERINGWYHQLHAWVLSRNAAEHLSHDSEELMQLMADSHRWFGEHGLAAPDVYVPPAWALGKLSPAQLQQLPYRYVETTQGVIDTESQRLARLPLVGFEADTRWRKLSLTLWNHANAMCASERWPLRISIHPRDGELLLSEQLFAFLSRVSTNHPYWQPFSREKAPTKAQAKSKTKTADSAGVAD